MAGSVSSVAIVGGMFQDRAEHDVRHALAEDWRLVARLADHRADVEHDAVPLVRLEVEVGNVDAEVPRAQVVRQIPPAFQVHRHLTDARVERDVEGRARLLVNAAGRRQPVVLLEDADGQSQGLVEARALDRCRTEVAGGCEPLSERGHRRTRGAGPQARGRHTRPSALRFGAAQRGETPAERRVLVVRRLDALEPPADVVSRRGEARGEIGQRALRFPAAIHGLRGRSPDRDITPELHQRRGHPHVEDRLTLIAVILLLARQQLAIRRQRVGLIGVGAQPVIGRRGQHGKSRVYLRVPAPRVAHARAGVEVANGPAHTGIANLTV